MKVSLFKSASSAGRPKPVVRPSIRGRISGPIPIPNPIDDDEFPIRSPGTTFASTKPPPSDDEFPIRLPSATMASPIPVEPQELEPQGQLLQGPEELQEPQASTSAVSGSHADVGQGSVLETADPPSAPLAGPSPSPAASATRASPSHRRTNPSSTLRYSLVSAASTGNTGRSSTGPPQRKKSTLRNALSRFFGRKKKTDSQDSRYTEQASGLVATQQHRSDPTALNRAKDNEPKRSASLPITEFDRALRSHSVGPQDITAIESARNSIHTDATAGRRRAATTTGRLFTYHAPRRGEPGEWAGLSPRPASAYGRGSHALTIDEDPSEIGRAITSDSAGELSHRRRSRSLSGIQDLTGSRPQARRRSDEIRYWRESYDRGFMSPISSNNGPDNDDTGAVSVSIPDSPAMERPPKTPPQPFTFGSIAKMNEMAGMKITQAASIEMRMGALEAYVRKLERVVDQLCHSVPGFSRPLMMEFAPETVPRSVPQLGGSHSFVYTTAAPPMIPAIYHNLSAAEQPRGGSGGHPGYSSSRYSVETDEHSHMSFGEGQTYIGSLHPPSSSATHTQSILAPSPSPAATNRATSTSTVRGATSLPTLGTRTPDTEPDWAAQLEAERAARQALEAQVRKLNERLNGLSTTMFAMVRDPAKSRSQERLAPTTSTPTSTATTTPTGPLSMLVPAPVRRMASSNSMFEEDNGSDLDDKSRKGRRASPSESGGDETSSEAFGTPLLEQGPHYGAFGEELRDNEDDPHRKKAARTLSLSQLTLGKEAAQI